MKLHAIQMINAGNFIHANLTLDEKSIQLAGRNNKGKTSLLWTLLYLFVVDRKKTLHPDYSFKETLNFYFRNQEKSFIVYEGFDEKQGYFYMLLKRDGDTIKYYFAKKKFSIDFLVKDGKILSFKKVLGNPETGITTPLKDINEILARVISAKRGDIGFLRLENSKGGSRRFPELYKHLFRSSRNDSDILKNGIMVALGNKEECIDFKNDIGHDERIKWERELREINKLKNIQSTLEKIKSHRKAFEEAKTALKTEVAQYDSLNMEALLEEVRAIIESIEKGAPKLQKRFSRLLIYTKRKEIQKENLRRKEGKLGGQAEMSESLIKKAKSYGEASWLKAEIGALKIERYSLSRLLEDIGKLTNKEEVEKRLNKLDRDQKRANAYISNNENILLMNLSENKDEIAFYNAILSDEVKILDKSKVRNSPDKIEDNKLYLNNACLDVSTIEPLEIETKEEKVKELQEIDGEIARMKSILMSIDQKEEINEKLRKCEEKLHSVQTKLKEVELIEQYEADFEKLQTTIEENSEKLTHVEDSIRILNEETSRLSTALTEVSSKIDALEDEGRKIYDFNTVLKSAYNYIPKFEGIEVKMKLSDVLENIEKWQLALSKRIDEASSKKGVYTFAVEHAKGELRGIRGVEEKENDAFLSLLDEKCYGLDIREKDFVEMVKAGHHIFFQHIKRFLGEIETIETYIRRINKIIAGYSISDLSTVKIAMKLNQKQIDILNSMNGDEIDLYFLMEGANELLANDEDVFAEYIRTEKVIHLSELFSINVEKEKNNVKEPSKQSNGTERMLHVMLLLILMREMINKEDTIPFLIDEIADIDTVNQAELISFFEELNLLPISASPKASSEFDKIYHIEEINGRSFLDDRTSTHKINKRAVEEVSNG